MCYYCRLPKQEFSDKILFTGSQRMGKTLAMWNLLNDMNNICEKEYNRRGIYTVNFKNKE